MPENPKFEGLKFQPVKITDRDGNTLNYVIRSYLPPQVSENEAAAIVSEMNKDFHKASERHTGQVTPSANSFEVVRSKRQN